MRFYICKADSTLIVHDYLSYNPIAFLDLKDKDTKKYLKRLDGMSPKEYIKHLLNETQLACKIKPKNLIVDRDKEADDWINKAWKPQTKVIANELKIKLTNEPIQDIKDLIELLDQEENPNKYRAPRKALKPIKKVAPVEEKPVKKVPVKKELLVKSKPTKSVPHKKKLKPKLKHRK